MKRKKIKSVIHSRQGIVMLITLVVLVIMASLGYTLATRVAAQKHRQQYVIDYQIARYACDSGFKFASSMLGDVTFRVIDRPNEPDFSDLFAFTDEQYEKFIAQYIMDKQDANDSYSYSDDYDQNDANDPNRSTYQPESNMPAYDMNDANFAGIDMNDVSKFNEQMRKLHEDPNKITIPGPYGPQWPLAAAPLEFEIGNSKIIVEIEDENAKFPIMLGAVTDKETQRKAQAAFDTFCEWMVAAAKDKAMTYSEISTLKSDMLDLAKIIDLASDQNSVTAANKEPNNATAANTRFRSRNRRAKNANAAAANQQPQQNPNAMQRTATSQYSDFAKMFNSSLVHTEPLAVPYIKSDRRTESAMKYLNRWGSKQININSAPRHVLESVFVMGGDAPGVSDQIILERKIKPFSDVNDLQKRVFRYSDTIQRCKPYLTTQSKFFTVKVTAVSGVATARITAAVLKDGKNVQTIGIISE